MNTLNHEITVQSRLKMAAFRINRAAKEEDKAEAGLSLKFWMKKAMEKNIAIPECVDVVLFGR
jgi:hypothetical protein